MSEWIKNEFSFPLHCKVIMIFDGKFVPSEHMRFKLSIRTTSHPCNPLVATALINGENKENWVLIKITDLVGLLPHFAESFGGSKSCRPHACLIRFLQRLKINALHHKEASILVKDRSLFQFALPFVNLCLVPGFRLLVELSLTAVVLVAAVKVISCVLICSTASASALIKVAASISALIDSTIVMLLLRAACAACALFTSR